jgi:3-hydroxybenzoate 6-monooxygenase
VSDSDPILIVGGGLGGLTTALALAQRGRATRVLEGAPEFGAIGYGIQFGPNVFHVFDRLGVREEVLAVADAPSALLMLDALDGRELIRIPTGASFHARFKQPYIVVHRIDVHSVLLDACRRHDAIDLVSEAMVTGFEDRGDRVAVTAADGRMFTGAAVVAADGVRSLFRGKLVGDGEPHAVGYAAHRTIAPMADLKTDVPRDCVVLWGGPGFHIVHYPLRHGTLFNVVAVFRTPTHGERGDAASYLAELQHNYRDARPAMRALLEMLDLGRRWQIGYRDPVRHWHRGRVVLLGDAAHASLQSLAQGACMAIEDGFCLAELIHASGEDFAAAFRRFEAARLLRTARVQLESRAMWLFYHAEGIARDVRNATVADWDERYLFNCLAWLYDGAALPAGAGG